MREKTITAAVDELRQRLALTTGPRNVAHVADGHDRLTEFLGRPPTEDEHRQIVAYAAAHPWWEGAARSASAVYGPHLTTYATEALAIDPLAGVRTAIAATDERWADYTERIAARASAAKAKGEKFEQTADELAEATEIADEADRLHTERKRIQAEAAEQHRRRG
jgi:hypothetical protein